MENTKFHENFNCDRFTSSMETVLIEKKRPLIRQLIDLSHRNDTRQRNIAWGKEETFPWPMIYKKVPIDLVGLILQLHRAACLSRMPTITV